MTRVQRARGVPAEEAEKAKRRGASARSDGTTSDAVSGPVDPAAASLLALQRDAGNAAVNAALAPIQRKAAHDDETHQHAPGCGHTETAGARSTVEAALRAPGKALPSDVRTEMESRLNHDFSGVRIHTNGTAHKSAEQLNAHAYTSGNHIVFQRGRYDTASTAGKRMLAHELIHVKQQHSGPVAGTDMGDGTKVSDPGDRYEREAEAGAKRAMSGSVPVQRAATRPSPPSGSSPEIAVQRCSTCRDPECRHGDLCGRRGRSSSRAPSMSRTSSMSRAPSLSRGRSRSRAPSMSQTPSLTSGFDRLDISYVSQDTMRQNPPGRRAITQDQVMGGSAKTFLAAAGRKPQGTASHLHTAAAYSYGDGYEGQTQRATNLTPGSQATNLVHKNYEDAVGRDLDPPDPRKLTKSKKPPKPFDPRGSRSATSITGLTVTQMGLSGEKQGGAHKVYDRGTYETYGPSGLPIKTVDLDLHDYRDATKRRKDGDYVEASSIRRSTELSAIHSIMRDLPDEAVPAEYEQFERRRQPSRSQSRGRSSSPMVLTPPAPAPRSMSRDRSRGPGGDRSDPILIAPGTSSSRSSLPPGYGRQPRSASRDRSNSPRLDPAPIRQRDDVPTIAPRRRQNLGPPPSQSAYRSIALGSSPLSRGPVLSPRPSSQVRSPSLGRSSSRYRSPSVGPGSDDRDVITIRPRGYDDDYDVPRGRRR